MAYRKISSPDTLSSCYPEPQRTPAAAQWVIIRLDASCLTPVLSTWFLIRKTGHRPALILGVSSTPVTGKSTGLCRGDLNGHTRPEGTGYPKLRDLSARIPDEDR